MMANEYKDYKTCDGCAESKGCTEMNHLEEISCCECERIDIGRRCNWCNQDYIDGVAE